MKIQKSKLAWSLVAIMAVVGVWACGSEESSDAGVTKKDGGSLPPPPDAGNNTDGGTNTTTDGGTNTSTTTVPAINKKEAASGTVSFKAIAVSPLMFIKEVSNSANPADNYCRYGLFVADETAAAENNGLLLLSESTVTGTECNSDSQIHGVAIGDEVQVKGYYRESCTYWNTTTNSCNDKDSSGNDIALPQVLVSRPGDVTKTGRTNLSNPNLPAAVTIDEVNSTGTAAPFTLGSKWWTYRTVLVKVQGVKAVDVTQTHCEWVIAPKSATTPTMHVDDPYVGTACPHRPTQGAEFDSLAGNLYFGFSNAKLLPRNVDDAVPPLPSAK